MGLKDIQGMAESGGNYIVENLEDKRQRITVTIERNGKELAIVLRASKKRGCVISRVDGGGLGMLAGLKEGLRPPQNKTKQTNQNNKQKTNKQIM